MLSIYGRAEHVSKRMHPSEVQKWRERVRVTLFRWAEKETKCNKKKNHGLKIGPISNYMESRVI